MSETQTQTQTQARALLEVDDATLRFGGLTALDHVSFEIREGEILGLIGPNGAGKTTCFNAMTGVYQLTSGQVRLEGQTLAKMKRNKITKLGLARTFQGLDLYEDLLVGENVAVGQYRSGERASEGLEQSLDALLQFDVPTTLSPRPMRIDSFSCVRPACRRWRI